MSAQPPAQGEAQARQAIYRLRHSIRFSVYGVSPYTGMTSDLSTLIDDHVSLAAEVARLRAIVARLVVLLDHECPTSRIALESIASARAALAPAVPGGV